MNERPVTGIERESAFLLLVLQSGIGLVTAAGPFLLAIGGSPGNALLGVLTVLLAVTELVLAVLFLRGSRRAASWLAGYQALCLWGAGWALAIHLGADNHFAALVTNVVIPTLLRYFGGSALVIDPKGENAAVPGI